jgi:hypothetical protein
LSSCNYALRVLLAGHVLLLAKNALNALSHELQEAYLVRHFLTTIQEQRCPASSHMKSCEANGQPEPLLQKS